MAIGETFLSAFLQVLFEKLLSPGVYQFLKLVQGGIKPKTIKQWERQLRLIEAVLSDAEHKQLQSNAVKSWLQQLQDLAYDLEDVLDAFATETQLYELATKEDDSGRKEEDDGLASNMVQSIFLGGSRAAGRISSLFNSSQDFSSMIEEIGKQLKDIVDQSASLGLSVHMAMQQQVLTEAQQCNRESTSLLSEPNVYGRDHERKEIIQRLLNENSSSSTNYNVIPIVGKAGIGKTTLAQAIYNAEEASVFAVKAWVHVSHVFDVKRITTSILNSITGKSSSFSDLNQAQVQLQEVLGDKRFLIVLDDIWSERYRDWDYLRIPFRAAAKGSKVLATTRSQKVARIMTPQNSNMISLGSLADDDCWRLILQHAFEDVDIVVSPNLAFIRETIVQKCKGLPLVAKTLGGLLRTKVEEREWQEILSTSSILDMNDGEILSELKLSYNDLPSHLKRCFAYCSIFPKDHVLTEQDVILLWMAEGLLPECNVGNRKTEDIGHEYFQDLVSRSFFELSAEGSQYFRMHGLLSDLAQLVVGDVCLTLDSSERENHHNVSDRVRHLSISRTDVLEDLENLLSDEKVSRIRTCIHFDKHTSPTARVLDLIGTFRYIRVLSLPHLRVVTLSNSIRNLKLLRYLNLSYSCVEELPDSISNLCNLQTLLLRGCDKLQRLVTNMRCLVNLRHMDINGTQLHEMPLGIGNSTNLQTLQNFVIGAGQASIIRELKDLKNLRGRLTISGLENVVNSEDAREAKLHEKSSLQKLDLMWQWGNFANGVDDDTKRDVLDQLQPHRSTEVFTLRNYTGVALPSWLGDPSFSKMVTIRLVGCVRCESLPPLGKLPSLKELIVQEMRGIKTVDSDFYGTNCTYPFASLKTLKFKSMASWEMWLPSPADNKGFPCLQELSIENCPLLQECLPPCLPLLQTLEIRHCKKFNVSLPSLPSLQKMTIEDCCSFLIIDQLPATLRQLVISGCQNLQTVEFGESNLYNGVKMTYLEVVEIVNCQSLTTLLSKDPNLAEAHISVSTSESTQRGHVSSPKQSEKLAIFSEGPNPSLVAHLTKLTMSGCPHLICFPENLVLPRLQNLLISVCINLEALPNQIHEFTSLQDFILSDCPKIRSFPASGLPSKLISLYIDGVKMEQPLQEWNLHSLNSLQSLSISDVGCSSDSIESFPLNDLHISSSLISLAICGFLNLKSVSCLGVPNLTSLYVKRCPKLEYFLDNCLPFELKELWVIQCPLLKQELRKDHLRHTLSRTDIHLRIC